MQCLQYTAYSYRLRRLYNYTALIKNQKLIRDHRRVWLYAAKLFMTADDVRYGKCSLPRAPCGRDLLL